MSVRSTTPGTRRPAYLSRGIFALFILLALALLVPGANAGGKGPASLIPSLTLPSAAGPLGSPTPSATATSTPACGLTWRTVSSPNVGPNGDELWDIAAVSANDVWAVGFSSDASISPAHTLIDHWDGTQWSVVPSDALVNGGLLGVDAVAANDIWAVGFYNTVDALTMHWDGAQWSTVPSPGARRLNGVSALSPNDVWAVGREVLRWNGSQWSQVPIPGEINYDNLFDVEALTPNNVWVVGHSYLPGTGYGTITLNWNGTTWTRVPSPNTGSPFNSLYGITAIAANDIWAVGSGGGGYGPALALHWNGTQWSEIPNPNPGPYGSELRGVAGTAPNDVWAVGYAYFGGDEYFRRTTVLHWDGTQWRHVSSPNPATGNNQLYSVDVVSNEDVWAVGFGNHAMNFAFTLTQRFNDPCVTPSPTSPLCCTPTRVPTYSPPTSTSTRTFTSTPSSTPCPLHFTDVHPADYFYEAVRYLFCRGVISGYSDNAFRPYNHTTRAQLTKIVVLAEGWPLYTPPVPTFIDVPATHTFYQYVETAHSRGIIFGYADGTFRPGENVTRGQLCKIVVLAKQWPLYTPPTSTFTDVPPTHPFHLYIETAYAHLIVTGYSDLTFRPHNPATRGQICKIVCAALVGP